MSFKDLRKIARPKHLKVLLHIKCSLGLSVGELSGRMRMSYMGVKNLCDELLRQGLITTWRRAHGVGRPEKAFQITAKGNQILPSFSNPLVEELLVVIGEVHGATAPEKLLMGVYQRMAENYGKKVSGEDFRSRARSFARIRSGEGYLIRVEESREDGLVLAEYHNPMEPLFRRYPSLVRMEENLVSEVLRSNLSKTEETAGELKRICYREQYALE